jgi:hypothetical protein
LIEHYISYISIVVFLKNNMENTHEFMDKIVTHADKLGFLCSYKDKINDKILAHYKASITEIIKITNANNIDTDKITTEQCNFEKKVKKLNRKYILK